MGAVTETMLQDTWQKCFPDLVDSFLCVVLVFIQGDESVEEINFLCTFDFYLYSRQA